MKHRLVVAGLVLLGSLALATGPAAARGGAPIERVEAAGFMCFDPDGPEGPLGPHCAPPAPGLAFAQGPSKAIPILYYSPDGVFQGTELLRITERDLSNQPCPGDGTWFWVGFAWACHHPQGGGGY
jgi:hypothetical protein